MRDWDRDWDKKNRYPEFLGLIEIEVNNMLDNEVEALLKEYVELSKQEKEIDLKKIRYKRKNNKC